jgi:hypothetical protein
MRSNVPTRLPSKSASRNVRVDNRTQATGCVTLSAQSDTEVTADRGDAGGDPLAAVGYPVWQPLRSQLRNALGIRTPMNETEAETGHSNLSFHGQWFFHQSRH